ncbi:hypothetical protein F8Y87_02120 [Vibrio alginolyticus]|nr:hypothetical protein [Vibrio alginolyticus]
MEFLLILICRKIPNVLEQYWTIHLVMNNQLYGVLWALILNAIAYAYPIKCLSFEGQFNEVSRND